jgi:integrase
MPLTLIPPILARRSPNYRVRGTYLGVRVDRSTETGDKRKATAFKTKLEAAIERGAFASKPLLNFAEAATSYMQSGGERRFLAPLLRHFKETPVETITQADIDASATAVYPHASPATRNRQFYTPLLAILHHAKIATAFSRPKGAAGTPRTVFLKPDEFERLSAAAARHDREFGALVDLLCYTGLRLSEALRLKCEDLRLDESVAFCGMTKNGEPRPVHLPPRVVAQLANHPRGLDRTGRLFRWSKCGEIYSIAKAVYRAAQLDDHGAPFHILRHSYGAWMTRAGADLVATGAWKSTTAARGYQHFIVTEEARKADELPGSGAIQNKP